MYQDGQEVGSKKIVRKILDTKKEKFYIGMKELKIENTIEKVFVDL